MARCSDWPGRYRLLALLESAAYSWNYRRPVWITKNGRYWTVRTWRGATTVSASYRWRGPDFWRNLTEDLLFFQYRPRGGRRRRRRRRNRPGAALAVPLGCSWGEGDRHRGPPVHVRGIGPVDLAQSARQLRSGRGPAVSDRTGLATISDVDDPDLNSTLTGALAADAEVQVPAFTLDDLAQRMSIERIDLLK